MSGAADPTDLNPLPALPHGAEIMRLGRDQANHIVLATKEVSRFHAEIFYSDGHYHIRDRGSLNGTWVNESEVKTTQLTAGDLIRIGHFGFRFDGKGLTRCEIQVAKDGDETTVRGNRPTRKQAAPTPQIVKESWDPMRWGPLSEGNFRRKLESDGYSVSRNLYEPGASLEEHNHSVDKFEAVLSGRLRIEIQGQVFNLEAGDCLSVPAGVPHTADVVGDEPVVSLDAFKNPS